MPGIVGFAAALAASRERRDGRRQLRDRLEAGVGAVPVVSAGAPRLPGHVLLRIDGLRADLVVRGTARLRQFTWQAAAARLQAQLQAEAGRLGSAA